MSWWELVISKQNIQNDKHVMPPGEGASGKIIEGVTCWKRSKGNNHGQRVLKCYSIY